jgi:hypothetical protein
LLSRRYGGDAVRSGSGGHLSETTGPTFYSSEILLNESELYEVNGPVNLTCPSRFTSLIIIQICEVSALHSPGIPKLLLNKQRLVSGNRQQEILQYPS